VAHEHNVLVLIVLTKRFEYIKNILDDLILPNSYINK